ncbi:MAG: hypothetical protein JOY81_02470 [Alphaproteobacteria bacterium]|nr:hypothetical protein [Alphaproteobacteria bacterium]
MIKRTVGWLAAALVSMSVSLPVLAQTAGQSVPSYAARSRTAGTAPERTAQVRCLALATSAFHGYSGPQVARENGEGAFFMSCMTRQMPNDWPNAADAQDQATRMAETARRADPSIDACLLTACASPPKDDSPPDSK